MFARHSSSGRESLILSNILSTPVKEEKIILDISKVRDADLKPPSLDPFSISIDNLSLESAKNSLGYGKLQLIIRLSNNPFSSNLLHDSENLSPPFNSFSNSSNSYFFYNEGPSFVIPPWLSIFPSILTIILAVTLRQSLLAIFSGAWLGTTLIYGGNPLIGFLRTLDTTLIKGMASPDHACVLLFCLFIGGMIGVLGVGGGANGLAISVTKFARTRRRAALATYLIGILTFFDDYASCLISGLTMKDITGMMKISREKLSFIADTCAANISAVSIVSSWICIEISYIVQEYSQLGMETDGYATFIRSLPYNFYPFSMLMFCLLGIILNRDFGPMLKAERRAHRTGHLVKPGSVPLGGGSDSEANSFLTPKKGIRSLWWNAAIPFLTVIIVVATAMLGDGAYSLYNYRTILKSNLNIAHINGLYSLEKTIFSEINKINGSWGPTAWISVSVPFNGLLWASFLASIVAILLVLCQRILTLSEAVDAWMNGAKSMLFAVLILIMAWGLGDVCRQLKAAEWITSSLGQALNPSLFPTIVFVTASAVSFATGSAWGTMSILFPLMIQMAYTLHTATSTDDPSTSVCLLATIASILGGAVWGNQSSPIADSCIMSSVSSGSDHNDHVSTQLGYTIPVGLISIFACSIPVGFGIYPWAVAYVIALILFLCLFFFVGGTSDANDDSNDPYLLRYFSSKEKNNKDIESVIESPKNVLISVDGNKSPDVQILHIIAKD